MFYEIVLLYINDDVRDAVNPRLIFDDLKEGITVFEPWLNHGFTIGIVKIETIEGDKETDGKKKDV